MRTKTILLITIFTAVIVSLAADPSLFDPEIIKAILKKGKTANELSHAGKSIKSERVYAEIEKDLGKLFTNGKIIQSDALCKFIKRTNGSDTEKSFSISCLEDGFFFDFGSESDAHIPDRQMLTKRKIVEDFEDISEGSLFSGRIMVVSPYTHTKTYSHSFRISPQEIIVHCKILEIRSIEKPKKVDEPEKSETN